MGRLKAYACLPLTKEQKNRFHVDFTKNKGEAYIGVLNPKLDEIEEFHPIFVQLESAGYEKYEGKFDCIVANASGAFGLGISEYVICAVLMLKRHMKKYIGFQNKHEWNRFGDHIGSIYGDTVLILGTGDLGSNIAKRMKAMGAYTIGFRRNVKEVDGFDEVHSIKELDMYISNADMLISCIPDNNESRYLLSKDDFKKMKSNLIFVNVGRGSLVHIHELEEVMEEGLIQGMVLDVVENEPLSKESILWDMENVIITPHISGTFELDKAFELFIDLAVENVNNFVCEKTLKNIVFNK